MIRDRHLPPMIRKSMAPDRLIALTLAHDGGYNVPRREYWQGGDVDDLHAL